MSAPASSFTPWDNPMGTDGFEFIEYAAPDPQAMGALFERMGFRPIAKHRHKNVILYRQGGINFIVNAEPDSFAQRANQLTPQQWRVLSLMVQGDQNKVIAHKLGVGEATVKAHVTVILRKLGVRSRTQAVIEARGLALPPG